MRAGMAAALARRVAAAALARGRGMCSAPAAAGRAAAALSSEELMRMERDCSAHKYVRPFLPPPSRSIILLANCCLRARRMLVEMPLRLCLAPGAIVPRIA